MSNKKWIFMVEQIGITIPGNDIMSAIASLIKKVVCYGAFIFLFILFLLCYIIEHFTRRDVIVYDLFAYDSLVSPAPRDAVEYYAIGHVLIWLNHWWYHFSRYIFLPIVCMEYLIKDIEYVAHIEKWQTQVYPQYFSKEQESLLDICFLLLPTCLVVIMLIPTLGFLYNLNLFEQTALNALCSIDIVGHQWYWTYSYNIGGEAADIMFDSILDVDAVVNALLEVDFRMVVPTNELISLTITSDDVIHSWSVPALGIKVDAVPGRITTTVLTTFMDGIFFGQCSELCGVLHGFMPICVESVPLDVFYFWTYLHGTSDNLVVIANYFNYNIMYDN